MDFHSRSYKTSSASGSPRYKRYRRLPVDDKELIAAVRDVGIIEEEMAQSRAQIQKMKTMGLEDSDDKEENYYYYYISVYACSL